MSNISYTNFFLFFSFNLRQLKILLSLFVAVILDNLELEEDVKKIKQVNKHV